MHKQTRTNRILVTGGAGFLGSHLIDRLVERGDEVICIDNLFTGSKENIKHHFNNPSFEFIRHDVIDPINIQVDQIFNLACPASPIHYQYDSISTTKTSVLGAINLLELAKEKNAKIFQASTSEVYGDPTVHPQNEEYWGNVNITGIRSCYDEGKRCAETLFYDYHRQHSVDIRVARIFNTYGPRMHPNDGRVVSNFIVQALKGHDITIYGDGSQTRSFCYVDDLIDAFMRYMDLDTNISNSVEITGPINLGNPDEFTILELAKKVISLTGSKSNMVFKNLPQDDPMQRKPVIDKARRNLNNWNPSIKLDEGLLKTINYFKKLI
jgi:UDP-glucuronate decarboxylase